MKALAPLPRRAELGAGLGRGSHRLCVPGHGQAAAEAGTQPGSLSPLRSITDLEHHPAGARTFATPLPAIPPTAAASLQKPFPSFSFSPPAALAPCDNAHFPPSLSPQVMSDGEETEDKHRPEVQPARGPRPAPPWLRGFGSP